VTVAGRPSGGTPCASLCSNIFTAGIERRRLQSRTWPSSAAGLVEAPESMPDGMRFRLTPSRRHQNDRLRSGGLSLSESVGGEWITAASGRSCPDFRLARVNASPRAIVPGQKQRHPSLPGSRFVDGEGARSLPSDSTSAWVEWHIFVLDDPRNCQKR
jgi:hypothetical protein